MPPPRNCIPTTKISSISAPVAAKSGGSHARGSSLPMATPNATTATCLMPPVMSTRCVPCAACVRGCHGNTPSNAHSMARLQPVSSVNSNATRSAMSFNSDHSPPTCAKPIPISSKITYTSHTSMRSSIFRYGLGRGMAKPTNMGVSTSTSVLMLSISLPCAKGGDYTALRRQLVGSLKTPYNSRFF